MTLNNQQEVMCLKNQLNNQPTKQPRKVWFGFVVYWPTTRPGCQNRKCTSVNNRCIRSRNIRIITLTVDRLNECEIVTPTRRRWVLNNYIMQSTGNSISLETRPVGDKMRYRKPAPERLGPRPPVEQTRRTGKKRWWP